MNFIDKEFNSLQEIIESKSIDEIYQDIKNKFLTIPVSIQDSLEDYFRKFSYWGKLDRKEGIYEELYLRARALKENLNDYVVLYNRLGDYRSKKILLAILSNYYRFDFNTLSTCIEKNYDHYFDLDLVKCDKDEVFVDLGSYTGDTINSYLNNYGPNCYKKIYGYEITKESYEISKNNLAYFDNIDIRNKAISNKNEVLNINYSLVDNSANTICNNGESSVDAVSLDSDIEDKITMIKMDIEGYEEKALEGSIRHIKEEHPKLLISVYHNHEDLYKLPKLIDSMDSSYKYYLRYYGGHIYPTETVLIAI